MIDLQFVGKVSYKLVKRFVYFNDLNHEYKLHFHPTDFKTLLHEYREIIGDTKTLTINDVLIEPDTSGLVPVKCVNLVKT